MPHCPYCFLLLLLFCLSTRSPCLVLVRASLPHGFVESKRRTSSSASFSFHRLCSIRSSAVFNTLPSSYLARKERKVSEQIGASWLLYRAWCHTMADGGWQRPLFLKLSCAALPSPPLAIPCVQEGVHFKGRDILPFHFSCPLSAFHLSGPAQPTRVSSPCLWSHYRAPLSQSLLCCATSIQPGYSPSPLFAT